MGMAGGLALAAGSARVTDEHALLALLYQGWLDHFLDSVDLTLAEIVPRLAARGVAVPPLLREEPPPPRGPIGPRVYFPATRRELARACAMRSGGGRGTGSTSMRRAAATSTGRTTPTSPRSSGRW